MHALARHARASELAEKTIRIADQMLKGKVPADATRVKSHNLQWEAARWVRSEYSEIQMMQT